MVAVVNLTPRQNGNPHRREKTRPGARAWTVVFGAGPRTATLPDWDEVAVAQDKVCQTWVKAHRITVPYSTGQAVVWDGQSAEIVRVDEDIARVTARVPSLGHVRKGVGTNGIIVDSEDERLSAFSV